MKIDCGQLSGDQITEVIRNVKDLAGIFSDEKARKTLDPHTTVYIVKCHFPVEEGTPGNLFFGTTTVYSGKVGNEYFMTKGHFHEKSDRAEYYWAIEGEGMLILMDRNGQTRAEVMTPGSVHHIPAEFAHRVANTGSHPLSFGACWPSDAGHDYASITEAGFTARLIDVDGKPELI